jgi:hypothetical protein
METEICHVCKGMGERTIDVGTHTSDYETITCTTCNGTGRVITKQYSWTIPFTPNPQGTEMKMAYEADRRIVETIRALENGEIRLVDESAQMDDLLD